MRITNTLPNLVSGYTINIMKNQETKNSCSTENPCCPPYKPSVNEITSGAWEVKKESEEGNGDRDYLVVCEEKIVCELDYTGYQHNNLANAKLITQAPPMLSLLTQMKEALDDKSTNKDGLTVNETGWLLGINKILDNLK